MSQKPTRADCLRAIELANAIVLAGRMTPAGSIPVRDSDWGLIISGLRLYAVVGLPSMELMQVPRQELEAMADWFLSKMPSPEEEAIPMRVVDDSPIRRAGFPRQRRRRGYAIITMRIEGYATPRPLFAHRVSYEAFRRGIPEGKVLAHDPIVCNRRDCVNPHHVRATSPSENNRDKGRARRYRERLAEPVHILRREAT